jgi:site-specific DNA recombinase
VRAIYTKYAGGEGYLQILNYLNGMGYTTKAYTTKGGKFIPGKSFGKGSLNNILKNEKYIGRYIFNKKLEKDISGKRRPQIRPESEWVVVEGGCPAIVSKELFDTVQTKMNANAKNGGKFKAKEVYLLTGLIECGECGFSMSGNARHCGRNRHDKTKPKYVTYRCGNRAHKNGCTNTELRREYLEYYVLDELNRRLFSESSIKKLSQMLADYNNHKAESNRTELELANTELSSVLEKIGTVVKLVAQSGVSIDTVSNELRELDERKRFLEAYISELTLKNAEVKITEEMVIELINRSKDFIRTRNIPEIRQFINAYVEKVVVYQDTVDVIFKINVPDEDDKLAPMVSNGNIKELQLQREYVKVI